VYDTTNPPSGTGVSAAFTFSNFTSTAGQVSFDFTFENLGTTSSSKLGGVGFDLLPGLTFLSGGVSGSNILSSYNANGTAYEDVFAPGALGGLSTYDIALQAVGTPDGTPQYISNANQFNGTGEGVQTALSNNQSATVKFTFTSSLGLDAAATEQAYFDFFKANAPNAAGARFQSIVGSPVSTSDKIGSGQPTLGGGGGTPGDSVPGPLPLFGAAAAFGYSRKLRRRLKTSIAVIN
jgi:hypothetical protein